MRGFTIIELVLVIAMLGVLGVTAVVKAPSASPAAVTAAARQVNSDISIAQQNAMMTGQISGVSFVNNGAYTVYQGTTATPLRSPHTNLNMIVTLSTNYTNVRLNSNYVVEFNKFGAPATGGGGSVQITDGINSKTITVTANTGMVNIQ